jgi:regulatory protein
VARLILLRRLTAAPASRADLAALLHRRGVPEEAAAEALDRFEEVGLIDDAAFAEAWVQTRHTGRGLSSRVLIRELQAKGIAPALVAEAVAVIDPETERAAALLLARRRAPRLAGLPSDVALRRLSGFLARKGYGAAVSYAIAREVLGAAEE